MESPAPMEYLSVEAPEAISTAMSIYLISSKIFKYLSFSDVLACSVVNRDWNISARGHLRDKRICMASINGHETCRQMNNFGSMVQSSFNAPFNGLKVYLRKLGNECAEHADVAKIHALLREKFDIRHLSIFWTSVTRCPVERLVQDLIQDDCLESLTVTQLPFNMISLVRLFHIPLPRNNSWLPNVKTLSFECVPNDITIFELIAASPQVRSIHGMILVHHLPFITHFKKCHAVRDFVFEPKPANAESCMAFALERPRLRKLSLSSYWWYWPLEFLQPIVDILKIMAESSSNSMEELTSDQLNLIWLSNTGLTFPGVTKLTVRYDKNVDEREGYSSLQKIDFNRLFPNLQTVQLWGEHVYVEDLSLFHTAAFRNSKDFDTSPCRVLELKISHARFWEDQEFQSFGAVFPCIKKLYFESSQKVHYCLALLWNTWEDVESISIDTRDVLAEENLDSLFCGISREEADEVSRESADFLRLYQFAPIRPSLSNLKQLRSLKLNVSHSQVRCRERNPSPSMLSETTGYLTLKRMPKLTMKISRNVCLSPRNYSCGYRMDGLKPFVTFLRFRYWS